MSTTTAEAIKERPILFSAPMVRAIQDGTKTQTRRAIKDLPDGIESITNIEGYDEPGKWTVVSSTQPRQHIVCPYGKPGDRLWVREAWRLTSGWDDHAGSEAFSDAQVKYDADGFVRPGIGDGCWGRYRHARFMPRKASRLTLEVASVRVERLQEISDNDAAAEGVAIPWVGGSWPWISKIDTPWRFSGQADNAPSLLFRHLWESINGKGSWDANPFVWCVEFRRVSAA